MSPRLFVPSLVLLLATAGPATAQHWSQWRGPAGLGVSTETDIAIRWSPGDNIVWQVPLEGLGTSTPIIWGNLIFLTSQIGIGPGRRARRAVPGDAPRPPAGDQTTA